MGLRGKDAAEEQSRGRYKERHPHPRWTDLDGRFF